MFIAIGLVRLVAVALGLQAVVVVLQSPAVGKAIAEAALEVPFGVRIFLTIIFGEVRLRPVAGVNRSALELTKSAYNKKVDEADGMSNRKEAEKHVAASKAHYDAAREDLCRAEQAFADFSEHDFR